MANDEINQNLIEAIDDGDKNALKQALEAGADVNRRHREEDDDEEDDAVTPLYYAIKHNSAHLAEILLDAGADIDAANEYWQKTALQEAAHKGLKNTVELLIQRGAEIEKRDRIDYNALHYACIPSRYETAEFLLNSGADVNALAGSRFRPMHIAARDPKMMELLLSRGADINPRNNEGDTPLDRIAEQEGSQERNAVKFLRGRGGLCRYEIPDPPLYHAACDNNLTRIEELLEREEDPNIHDNEGWTALHYIAQINSPEALEIIMKFSPDLNLVNDKGDTPLLCATQKKHEDLAIQLLKFGADPNIRNKKNRTALSYSLAIGLRKLARALIRGGADPNGTEETGWSILHVAVANDRYQEAALLLERCRLIDFQDKNGLTALHMAARSRYDETIRLLAKNGADLTLKDVRGRRALDVYRENDGKTKDIILLLGGESV